MSADDKLKEEFRKKAQKEPEKHYPAKALQELGFARKQCSKCNMQFWSKDSERKVCGEGRCIGGLKFIGDSPAAKKMGFVQVWQEFEKTHKKLGYTPVKRYPVVARWNPTTEFTIANIAAFQPNVVSGEIKPPANPLAIPQFCLRFPDIDNVGITGHFVGFVMMGENAFVPPSEYDINKYFKDHMKWLTEGMGIPAEEISVHEDSWAGGGNYGPCVEFFCRGLEISNQVYMQYENGKELAIKVLDMGQGQERAAWFINGTPTSYDAAFPDVLTKLKDATGIDIDTELMKKFIPHSPYLDVHEAQENAWEETAEKLGMNADELKKKILPVAGLYSVAEHSRALLFALNDGALPSNVGGMYNLRVILRRALGFIDKYNWKIDICDVCEWHAEELREQYPELKKHLANVRKILEVEKMRYRATKEKTKEILAKIAGKKLTTDDLIRLYDSQGIPPEMIAEEALKQGKKVEIPGNFYEQVSERHEAEEAPAVTERKQKIELGQVPDTEILFWDDWKPKEFNAKVLKIIDNNVVLDKTDFYPVSGGQINDTGTLEGQKVIDVFKQGKVIIHTLAEKPRFNKGDGVKGKIDFERRKQLAQHHTATHIIGASARQVLGPHINQASAKKETDKAHIDLTHYQAVSDSELRQIEQKANEIAGKGIEIRKFLMPKNQAEQKYGFQIYQGGAAPGKTLRIVEIPSIDVQACGGIHLNNTSETGKIRIIKSTKIKDGIVRIAFAAGKAAEQISKKREEQLQETAKLLGVSANQIPARAKEIFNIWKKAKKALKKNQKLSEKEFKLKSPETSQGDIIAETAEILNTQPEHINRTLKRFMNEIKKIKEKMLGSEDISLE